MTVIERSLAALAILMLMVGCGGGGEGAGDATVQPTSSPPPVPSPTLPIAPTLQLNPERIKTFRFTWVDVSGETEYRLLEDPDGVSGFSSIATLSANETSHLHGVFLPDRINARYILQACNEVGCTSSATVAVGSNLAGAVGYAKASNTDFGDEFGTSVSISGDGSTLIVGAPHESSGSFGINAEQDNNSAYQSGAVYVFELVGGEWSQRAYIKASNAREGYWFGGRVAISHDGNTFAVGSAQDSSNARTINGDETNTSAGASGAVYVFARSNLTWVQQAYVKASNADSNDRFGYAISISANGNKLAVGAPFEQSNATGVGGDESNNSISQGGAVYVFSRTNNAWSQLAYVKPSRTVSGNRFGSSVTLSADGATLAVGAPNDDSASTGIDGDQANLGAMDSGAVYIFAENESGWSQQAYVKASNTEAYDEFGTSVALAADGDTLAVGAPGEDGGSRGINGNEASNTVSASGAAYVFTRNGVVWTQQAYVKASAGRSADFFGSALSLSASGDTLAVGAYHERSGAIGINGDEFDYAALGSGAIYVFGRDAGLWSQSAYVKASNTGLSDQFGWSVALSGDAQTLAVGAIYENSDATGINGNQSSDSRGGSGAVYLY